jgi:hypothetical protein
MKFPLTLALMAAITTPAMAHEIATPHAHTGGMVFIQLPQAALVLFSAAALLGLAIFATNKLSKGTKK